MKVGIITWYKYENYGTVLQAIALHSYLKTLGCQVELINFDVDDGKAMKACKKNYLDIINEKMQNLKNKYWNIRYNFFYDKNKKLFEAKSKKFEEIILNNCNISSRVKSDSDYVDMLNRYDFVFFGSDQIWNPRWYHPYYFGNLPGVETTLVAYAPSFGGEFIPNERKLLLKESLQHFDFLSSREESGKKIIENLTGREASVVVDPTLLLGKEHWEKYEIDDENVECDNYLLVYLLGKNQKHWKGIYRYAKKNKLKIVVIPTTQYSYFANAEIKITCGVGEFLSLIKNATKIVTDSFHCTVFSIIYKKDFIVIERHNPKSPHAQNTRVYNLLNSCGLNDRILSFNSSHIPTFDKINYNIVDRDISENIKDSKAYIFNALKMEEVFNEKS